MAANPATRWPPVELEFLRPLLLGESIAPFRLLAPALAVIPVEGQTVLDPGSAAARGHRYLATWLRDIEAKWDDHASRRADGSLRMTLQQRIDHMRTLSLQLMVAGPRIVYTKAGTRLSAAVVEDPTMIVDHMAYWAPILSIGEAHYLCAVINSESVLQRVIPMQARGWRDPRHFDNLVWQLPIPEYDGSTGLHRELAAAGAEAERVAAAVVLPEGDFRRKRRAIREALAQASLAARMEALVGRLLGG